MKTRLLLFCCLCWSGLLHAQSIFSGQMVDENAQGLPFGTVALLHPHDSTLLYFAITDANGLFEIKQIKAGSYLLQSSFLGRKTQYKLLEMPQSAQKPMLLVLPALVEALQEVQIEEERIPIRLNKDTVEYDAAAYKTRESAVVEDLIKKLPGVEVDRAGNIKAMGEQVKRVLVDGKEFFGDNPQMATRNLPADAIKKVQVYDQKSDEAELTGMDDGSREKTINLLLKDNKKSAWLGEVQAAAGSNERFLTEIKAFRFTKKHQFAALGLANNLNRPGFSLQDYLAFNGGLGNVMQTGGIQLGGNNNLPVDFGQPQTGLLLSGVGGINYNYEARKFNRFNTSLLSNISRKTLLENSYSTNFLANGSFEKESETDQSDQNQGNRLQLTYRNRMDSVRNLQLAAFAGVSLADRSLQISTRQSREQQLLNTQISNSNTYSDQWEAGGSAAYLQRLPGRLQLYRIGASLSFRQDISAVERSNLNWISTFPQLVQDDFFQRNQSALQRYKLSTSASYRILPRWALEPDLYGQIHNESLNRRQGFLTDEVALDSLSPLFKRSYQEWGSGLTLRKLGGDWRIQTRLGLAWANWSNQLWQQNTRTSAHLYPMFSFFSENEYSKGKRWSLRYDSRLQEAGVVQLVPVVNILNPLQLVQGNPGLRPEYSHQLAASWMIFDQFSFTSLFTQLNFTYTHDKINWERTITELLQQLLRPINVKHDYRLGLGADFSTPWRKAGLTFRLTANESWQAGYNIINGVNNRLDNLTHRFDLSFENRKKEKIDWSTGLNWQRTDAFFSLQPQLNQVFVQTSFFSTLSFQPNPNWHLSTQLDITRFDDRAFQQIRWIPLGRLGVERYVFKNRRAMISLDIFDILNRNQGINRVGDANFLLETRSNTLGRYIMLGFKYCLNKFESHNQGGVDIKINR